MIADETFPCFFAELDETTTIITPNRGLSATLHKLYQHYQLSRQQLSWVTPDMLPLNSWIERLWQQHVHPHLSNAPLLLDKMQTEFLWEKIIAQSKASEMLLRVSETAHLAKSAWELMQQWQIDFHHPAFQGDDFSIFHHWVVQFQQACRDQHVIDSSALLAQITTHLSDQSLVRNNIMLVGFTEIYPQLAALLKICVASGSQLSYPPLSTKKGKFSRLSLKDTEAEIVAAARYAKAIYLKNKTATIGCVVPSLDKIRDRVLQVFSDVFAEENTLGINSEPVPFNISASKSLHQYPLIHTALQLLSLYKNDMPLEIFSYLLNSPFLGAAEKERSKRANFDSLLRKKNSFRINLANLLHDSHYRFQTLCPQLAQSLSRFQELVSANSGVYSFSTWAFTFNQMLTVLGWPGERSLDSHEYQTVSHWLALLKTYSKLDYLSPPVNLQDALQTLIKMAARQSFQPKSPEAPVQILGVLEAAGLPFDYLWISGMDDMTWPAQPKPNPFVPKPLQRELQMPHATAERELHYCQHLIQQFLHNAKQGFFSNAEKTDEVELQTSTLVRHLPLTNLEALALPPFMPSNEKIFTASVLESFLDESGPPLTTEADVLGGVNVIKQQALCPFKAFAEWRLFARELERPVPGLRAKDRGNVLHKTMELLWNQIKDQKTLNTSPQDLLAEWINTSIESAFNEVTHAREAATQYLALEKKRLFHLISDWLELEKKREPFSVLISEKTAQIKLNKLNLSLKIDRIDEVSEGYLIIDYKTGKNLSVTQLLSHRPEEPQLPLYAMLYPEKTIGITFAQLVTGDNAFKGISRDSLDIKGIKLVSDIKQATAASWQDQLAEWQQTLTSLGDQFSQGLAKVDPKDKSACVWCALKPLCRIQEQAT